MASGQPQKITIARSRSISPSSASRSTAASSTPSQPKGPLTREQEKEQKRARKEQKKAEKEMKRAEKEMKRAEKKQKRQDKKLERKRKIKGEKDKDDKKEPDDGVPRIEVLARPTSRRLRSLWDEKAGLLPPERRDKIKSALEEEYFLSPEQTEQYFQAMGQDKLWSGPSNMTETRDTRERLVQVKQRQKWLVEFSAQVAYHICDYLAKGEEETLVSNRLRSIADVVLERVAEILGERKPSRNNGGRLARFMIAISDRIAVWIETAVYRAEVLDDSGDSCDERDHVRLDREVVA